MTILKWIKQKIQDFKIWLINFIKKNRAQIQRGREVTEQMRADKLRKKNDWIANMKPGALRSIAVGMKTKASPIDVMKEYNEVLKYKRGEKNEQNSK